MREHNHVHLCVCIHVYGVYVCMQVCGFVCKDLGACIYMCVHVCLCALRMHVCVFVYVYACVLNTSTIFF